MQTIEHDLFGNVVVSDTQPQGFVLRARIWPFQLVQNVLITFENFLWSSTYGDKERFEAVVNHSAAAK